MKECGKQSRPIIGNVGCQEDTCIAWQRWIALSPPVCDICSHCWSCTPLICDTSEDSHAPHACEVPIINKIGLRFFLFWIEDAFCIKIFGTILKKKSDLIMCGNTVPAKGY